MPIFQVKTESPAVRCEICHQTDRFNPKTGVCARCRHLEFEKATVRKAQPEAANPETSEARYHYIGPRTVGIQIYFRDFLVGGLIGNVPLAVIGLLAVLKGVLTGELLNLIGIGLEFGTVSLFLAAPLTGVFSGIALRKQTHPFQDEQITSPAVIFSGIQILILATISFIRLCKNHGGGDFLPTLLLFGLLTALGGILSLFGGSLACFAVRMAEDKNIENLKLSRTPESP
jgi:hypothetical protein